jgi:flagellar biosynthesis protein FlhF
MHLKRYEVVDMGEAIAQIKRDLGPEAIILSTRTLRKRSGLFHLSAKPVLEVIAAVDPQSSGPVLRPAATASSRVGHAAYAPPAQRSPAPVAQESSTAGMEALRKELQAMREELQGLQGAAKDKAPAPLNRRRLPKILLGLHQQLVDRGLAAELAEKILHEVRGGRPAKDLKDEATLREAVLHTMSDKVKATEPQNTPRSSPHLMAFVGPTGVGKTTTIAKLAAVRALSERQRVALITLDTYRIAATEQLKVYGNIIGTPVWVATDRDELQRALRETCDYDAVFIDTAGRCHRSPQHIWEIKSLLTLPQPVEIHLVLSATTREEEAAEMIRQFSLLPLQSLLFTKLDESGSFGSLLNLALRTAKPLSYLTTGQRVPEDVEVASPERVVDLFWHGFWR